LPQSLPRIYVPVPAKFAIAAVLSLCWLAFSIFLALPWLGELSSSVHWTFAWFAVGGIAIVPGLMNAFLLASLAMDRRPGRSRLETYPPLTILVAAYNESSSIVDTVRSIEAQRYPGVLQVVVIDDGSTDDTAALGESLGHPWLTLVRQPKNAGKAAALNRGLALAEHDLVVTLDGDSYLYGEALERLVERYTSDPERTRAVAGTMLVRNSRTNWVTRMQEWDYFHGISAIKRVQSLYQGTLVAQGAFSIYDRQTLRDLGGWDECVGEDIVLTWAILSAGWRVGHAEDAICFTNAPESLRQLVRQRQRWARGMIEAFKRHPRILVAPHLSTLFVWWNLFFPWLDAAFTFCFIPGVLLAFIGIYAIAGPMTLMLLPLSLLMNAVMYRVAARTFAQHGLKVRRNPLGFLAYAVGYSFVMQPASVAGYLTEILGMRRSWGTK